MLRRCVVRRGGGGGGFLPTDKAGNLAPALLQSAKPDKKAPKGHRYMKEYTPQKMRKFAFGIAPQTSKKLVPIPEKVKSAAESVSAALSSHHDDHHLSDIAKQNIAEKAISEARMRDRDFLAHKVKIKKYDAYPETGEIVPCMEFLEAWVLDHHSILNDNAKGPMPVKMPWLK